MINSRIYGIVFVVGVVASIMAVTTISLQNATASQPCCPSDDDADVDVAETAEAGNATIAGATNQTTTNGNTTGVEFLSIQTAQSGSISQINDTAYTLELNNVANRTILFSERPDRVVESVSTSDFIGNWSAGQDSFAADAPNDALIVEDIQTGNLENAVIESFNPVYDMATNTLTYTIVAENATAIELPSQFGQSISVIDLEFSMQQFTQAGESVSNAISQANTMKNMRVGD